ncbi:MAG: Trm112 family protein [Thermodesulfobacteriota bacterium]|nr:Trm112 family protein [Thermodesulfobacteriota bacterium]
MSVSSELLAILACPKCKQVVELSPDNDYILCAVCCLRYPIRDDIPVMLLDEAESVES